MTRRAEVLTDTLAELPEALIYLALLPPQARGRLKEAHRSTIALIYLAFLPWLLPRARRGHRVKGAEPLLLHAAVGASLGRTC